MYVPLKLVVREWLEGYRLFRCRPLGLPNYPIETLSIVTPANDNRELGSPLLHRASECDWIIAWRRLSELGLSAHPDPGSLRRIRRWLP